MVFFKIFNAGGIPIGGDSDTVMHAPTYAKNPYDVDGWSTHYRQCFDMANLQGIIPSLPCSWFDLLSEHPTLPPVG